MVVELQKIQELFWQLTQAPEGVEKKFSELQRAGKAPIEDLNQLISERSPGQALERMEIYAQMYFWRIFESLEEDFAVTASLLGKESFHALVVEYLKQHPSQGYDLALVGQHISRFLSTFSPPFRGPETLLRELSNLEWQLIEVSREKEVSPLSETKLKEIPVDKWENLVLQRIPASRIICSNFDLINPWRKKIIHQKEPTWQDFLIKEQSLLLWRKNQELQLQDVEMPEVKLLDSLWEPLSFSQLCEACYEIEPSAAAQLAAQYLKRWVDWGILCLAA